MLAMNQGNSGTSMEPNVNDRPRPSHPLRLQERLGDPVRKRELNRQLFSLVAPRYDAVTRLLSLDRDRVWKQRLVHALPPRAAPVCLDLACGTGDLCRLLAAKYQDGLITGLDLSPVMLGRARARVPASTRVQFLQGDMGRIGLASESVDIVTGGYALRNAGDLGEALSEIQRVLKPGGIASFLDFSKSHRRTLQRLGKRVLKAWGAWWGWALHRDPDVYGYIAESLEGFPDRRLLAALFRDHGLEVEASTLYYFGLVQWVTVRKPRA